MLHNAEWPSLLGTGQDQSRLLLLGSVVAATARQECLQVRVLAVLFALRTTDGSGFLFRGISSQKGLSVGKTCTQRWSSASSLSVKGTLRDCPPLSLPQQWLSQVRTSPQHPFPCCPSFTAEWDLHGRALCPSPFTGLEPGVKILHSPLHKKHPVILCFSQKYMLSAPLKFFPLKKIDVKP